MPSDSHDTHHTPTKSSPGANSGRLFTMAALMARKGCYSEASVLMRRALDANECSEVEALDLQARIYAQQGRYAEAEALWLKAMSIDPGNKSYRAALDALVDGRLYRPWFVKIAVLTLAAAVIIAIPLWLRSRPAVNDGGNAPVAIQPTASPSAVADVNMVSAAANRVSEKITVLEGQIENERKAMAALAMENSELRRQLADYQRSIASSIGGLSERMASMNENLDASSIAVRESVDKMAIPAKKCLIDRVGEVLWFPVDLVLNLGGKKQNTPDGR
jgi:tetratricopeptide (TPR) repeat protein